jgi:hypothetical protein
MALLVFCAGLGLAGKSLRVRRDNPTIPSSPVLALGT